MPVGRRFGAPNQGDFLGNGCPIWCPRPTFDLDDNGTVDPVDLGIWVHELKNTWFGDANLDGEFSSLDFVGVFQSGKFETGQDAGWSEGDWNGDGVFSSGDFVKAFQDGGYEQGPRPAQLVAVPEPRGIVGLLLSTILVPLFRHRAAHKRALIAVSRANHFGLT